MSIKCHICDYNINEYFAKVLVRMCPDCKILYCKTCGSKALKKGKCQVCGKPTLKIKRPSKNPFEKHMTPEEKIEHEKEEGIYRLKVIWKGNKDAKKLSVGVHMFSVGTEFGGGGRHEYSLQCVKCR